MSARGALYIAGAACLALAFTALLWLIMGGKGQLALQPGDLGRGDYRLVSTAGGDFTAKSLEGQPSLVFFGYTHCPDVCPTTLGDIAIWQEALGPEAGQMQIVFISVDPERDSPAILKDYLSWLPGAIGASGTAEETAKALRAFRVFARKGPEQGGEYAVDHTATVLLFDRQGALAETISYQAPTDEALTKLRAVIQG